MEMSQSVSRGLTVYESGAVGDSSESGTPACATCCAVPRCCCVIGKLVAAAAPANSDAATAAPIETARDAERLRRIMSGSLRERWRKFVRWGCKAAAAKGRRSSAKILIQFRRFCP